MEAPGSNQSSVGPVGSGVTILLALANWTADDWDRVIRMGSGVAAMLVSLVTLYFMLKRRGRNGGKDA